MAGLRIWVTLGWVCLAAAGCAGRTEVGETFFMEDGFEGDFAPGVWGRGGECLVPGTSSFQDDFPRSGRAAS